MDEQFPRIWFTKNLKLDDLDRELKLVGLEKFGYDIKSSVELSIGKQPVITIGGKKTGMPYIAIYKSEGSKGIDIGYYSDARTYDQYVAGAEKILKDTLGAYKKKYNKNLKYKIQSKKDLMFVFPPKSDSAYKAFIASANIQLLHPYDWERLYKLARICHATRVRPTEMDFIRLLMNEGFEEEYAEHVACIFDHCLELLDN